jgi:hypothetical protein
MNNTAITIMIGIIIIAFGFLIFSTMNDESIEVPVVNVNTTANSSSTTQTQAQREAAFEAQRQETEAKKVAFTIDVTKLPEAQQLALKTMGVNETSIEITNAMVTCARADMSEERMTEVKGGATVTMGEGIKLISCYNDN